MLARLSVLLVLSGWSLTTGCAGCIEPELPGEEDNGDTHADTEADSGDTSDTARDSAPPDSRSYEVGCPQEELEPNDTPDEAQAIARERWLCGGFDGDSGSGVDIDVFAFEQPEGGWLEVDVDAEVNGSLADVDLIMSSDAGAYLSVFRDASTSDPYAVFPAPEVADWQVYLTEGSSSVGEDHDWRLLASVTKEPFQRAADCSDAAVEALCVTRNEDEGEDKGSDGNSTYVTADELPVGEWVYGTFEESGDLDVYTLTTTGEKLTYTWTVQAWELGSPSEVRLVLREDDDPKKDGYRSISVSYPGGAGGLDPEASYTSSEDVVETLYMTVREDEGSYGAPYWYLIRLDVEGGDA